jgi:hypothetical protein
MIGTIRYRGHQVADGHPERQIACDVEILTWRKSSDAVAQVLESV